MGDNLTTKVLKAHLVGGNLRPGEENLLKIDQVLMQDATGTMALMQFEQLGLDEIKPEFAIIYVDHNMLQLDYRNPEDHIFLQTCAQRYGIHYSRPGNGICHYVQLERFAKPGKILLGADSHTPTAGALGCLAVGAGGLDVAVALSGVPFQLETQKIVGVHLHGRLKPWVASKDVILEMLRRLSVKGGLGRIFEFTGEGVKTLNATARATICNMITELGATSGLFPADERVREFLELQDRPEDYSEWLPDPDATYDEEIEIDLGEIEPLIARPSNPDNVVPVREVAGLEVAQVCVGSSVNSSYEDLAVPAIILDGHILPPHLVMTVSPGSRQILDTISHSGVLEKYILAGARILEPACGPCVGMGQAPPSGKASVRTFNRNFPGRSGTADDQVYLCSPATAGATALRGVITDPRDLGEPPHIDIPKPHIRDFMVVKPLPPEERKKVTIIRGKNIVPPPKNVPLPESLEGEILIKLADNISTGAMAPDGAIVMADRSNVPALAQSTFKKEDPEFVPRAKKKQGGFILAGANYGQGSSREHAVLAPLHLGVRVVLAKGFARIHRRNLVHQGLLPVLITDEVYDSLSLGSRVRFPKIRQEIASGQPEVIIKAGKRSFRGRHDLNPREQKILLAGGLLNCLKDK
ncbi:MAG: aconitate hydratase [Thermodesulfobacteriota bacterium]